MLAPKRAGFSLVDVQSDVFCLMLARNRFLHLPTASSTFCDMLAHVSMRHCFKFLVTAAGVADTCLYNVHMFLLQSTNSVVSRTLWQTDLER